MAQIPPFVQSVSPRQLTQMWTALLHTPTLHSLLDMHGPPRPEPLESPPSMDTSALISLVTSVLAATSGVTSSAKLSSAEMSAASAIP